MRWRVDIVANPGKGHRPSEGPFMCQWRTLDADGNIEMEGTCDDVAEFNEQEGVFDPLDAFVDDYGVVEMQYRYSNDEEWRTL